MPLARFSLYAQGVDLYIAPTWANSDRWVASMRHIAFEGRCWVIGSGNVLTADDIPADTPGRDEIIGEREHWLNSGPSVIVDPEGEVVAGHYHRPDVFQLVVDRSEGRPLTFLPDTPAH